MKQQLPLLFLLLVGYNATSQPTAPRPTALAPVAAIPSDDVIIPAEQARIIAEALQRFEQLKPAYVERGKALQQKDAALSQKGIALVAKDSIIVSYARSLVLSERLRLSLETEKNQWRTKARRRGRIIGVVIAAPTLYGLSRLFL